MKLERFWFVSLLAAAVAILGGCGPDSITETPGRRAAANSDSHSTVITATENAPARHNGNPPFAPINTGAYRGANSAWEDDASTSPAVVVSGRVTYSDGEPVTSASVELHGHSENIETEHTIAYLDVVTATNGEGEYKLRGPDVARLQLQVKGEFPQVQMNLEKNSGERSGLGNVLRIKQDIVLPAAHKISGAVVNEAGQPIAGLPVHLRPIHDNNLTRLMLTQETTSTAAGEFSFDQVAGGKWMLGTVAPEYAPVVQQIDVPTTESLTLRLASRGGSVRGHVLMKAGGAPVAGITVGLHSAILDQLTIIENQETVSAADGTFSFDHVSSGPKRLFTKISEEQGLGMAAPFPEHIRLDERETTDIALYVYPGHSVSGLVFDKDTSEPLSGATVTAGAGSVTVGEAQRKREAVTGADGRYLIDRIFPDSSNIDLAVKLENFSLATGSSYKRTITVKPKEDQPEISKDLPMVRLVTISGIVVTRDDVPIPHARVNLVRNTGYGNAINKMPVKADGTFELETTPFMSGFVEAEANGYSPVKSELIEVLAKNIDGVKVVMDAGATVQGTVYQPDGAPASMAKLEATNRYSFGSNSFSFPQEIATTDEDGRFTIRDAPAKIVGLTAGKTGFANSESVALELKPGEVRGGVELRLREALSISGRVVDSGKKPMDKINLHAYGDGPANNTSTDKDGAFTIKGLAAGIYSINLYGNGAQKTVPGIAAGTKDLEIVLDDAETATMIGTVVDDTTGDVVADFVTPNVQVKKLQEPGKFEFSNLTKYNDYILLLSSPNHDEQTFQIVARSGAKTFEQTFRLGRNGAITGRVVRRGTTDPVPNVSVINWANTQSYMRTLQAPKNHTITDAEGRFTLAPVPIGENSVVIKPAAPLAEFSREVTLKSEETLDMGDIELAMGGTIRGQVLRGANTPVPDIEIGARAAIGSEQFIKKTTTDAEGRFELTGLPAESYTVSGGGASKSVVLAPEATAGVTLHLGGVTMRGTVTRGGQPAQISIAAIGPEGQKFSAYSDGNYTIENMTPGNYEFTLGGSNGTRETVEVPDQAEFVKDFVLSDGRIRVTVVDAAGEPVADATVEMSQKQSDTGFDQRWLNRSTDASTGVDGTHEFEGLNSGIYSVSARKEGQGTAMNPAVDVKDGQTESVRLELNTNGGTLVSVALSYATGQGLREAWCYLYGPSGTFTHSAQRDAAGIMTITNIPPGTYTTNVSYWSHSQSEKSVEIKVGETVTIEDVLYPAGAIHWLLRRADGQPAMGAAVAVTPLATTPEEQPRNGKTGTDGLYVERGLAAGDYQVTAQIPGKPPVTETFSVRSGDNTKRETTVPTW